jgi:ribosomal-protein-alanine N-acetyltransferase
VSGGGAAPRAPERLETARLLLRRPRAEDAEAIFARYASDPEVTRFVGFPRHRSLDETRAFLAWSDAVWARWPAGPYLVESRADARLIGSSGLTFETEQRAATGYVLARDAWGRGYASEALAAMVELARACGVVRLYALCHPEHAASRRVLEKCGFALEGVLRRYAELPNLAPGEPADLACYAIVLA